MRRRAGERRGEDRAEGVEEQEGMGLRGPVALRQTTGLIVAVALLLLAPNLAMQILPGVLVVLLGRRMPRAWHAAQGRLDDLAQGKCFQVGLDWAVLAADELLGALGDARPLGLRRSADLQGLGEASSGAVVGIPQSGEEMLLSDGRFLRLPDPANRRSGDRTAREGANAISWEMVWGFMISRGISMGWVAW
eukprot:Skav222642  [mRNA]  locus=scaffold10:368380:380096:- [translate_table: standard]